jgi:hypothetical protein
VSLRSIVLGIVQLLCEVGAGRLLSQCLQNYSYPIESEDLLVSYDPVKKYLSKDRSKSLINLLFS